MKWVGWIFLILLLATAAFLIWSYYRGPRRIASTARPTAQAGDASE